MKSFGRDESADLCVDTAQFEFKNVKEKCERRGKRASPQVGVESIRNMD